MKLRIGPKLILSFLAVLLLTTYIGISGINSQSTINDKAKEIGTNRLVKIGILGTMNGYSGDYRICVLNYMFAIQRNDHELAVEYEKKINDQINLWESQYPELDRLTLNAEGKKLLEDAKTAWSELKAVDQQMLGLVDQGKIAEALQLLYGESRDKYYKSNETLVSLNKYNKEAADKVVVANQKAYESARNTAIIVLVVAVLVGLGLAIFIAKDISKRVALVAETALRVAEGDLTVEDLHVKTKDEIGDMARAFNQMLENLRTIVREINSTSQSVAATSEEMSATAEEATGATTNVANAIQQVAKGSTEQSKGITETVQVMEQVASSIEQIAAGAQDQSREAMKTTNLVNDMVAKIDDMAEGIQIVKQVSDQNGVVAENGGRDVQKTVSGMLNVKKAVFESAQRIQDLGEQSNKIGEIIQVIDDIAEQTNLLALNAAIEAARAGEHGKGFAVVADEVRKLAERSGKATKEIAELITSVQRGTKVAVESMEVGTKEVEAGVEIAQQAGDSLKEIVQGVSAAGDKVNSIVQLISDIMASSQGVDKAINNMAAVTEENTAASEEISTAVQQVDASMQGVSALSQESAASAEEVSASTEELTAAIEQIAGSSQHLAVMSQDLQKLISRFRV